MIQADPDVDDIPWASPEIQTAYEAALGRFMLEFNRLDKLLTEVIEATLKWARRIDLVKPCVERDFWSRLLIIDLLKLSEPGECLADVPVQSMREIATHRNKVAHGHFDQNPYSGEFDIVLKSARATYTAEGLDSLTVRTREAWMALRYAEGWLVFSDADRAAE